MQRVGWTGWALSLACLCWLAAGNPGRGAVASSEPLPEPSVLMGRIMERAQAVAKSEAIYTYDKRAVREELNDRGQPVGSEERVYQVRLIGGVPFNRLVRIQGHDLTSEELQAESEREERFRQKLMSMNLRQMAARKQEFITPQLLGRFEFTVEERIVREGRPTLVVAFRPKPDAPPAESLRDKVIEQLAGTLWVDEADADTAQLSVRLLQPLWVGWLGVLGSVSGCELLLQRRRMPDGIWINAHQVLRVRYRKLTAAHHVRTSEYCSGFTKAAPLPGEPPPL